MWGDIIIAFTIAFMTAFMATPHTINLAKKVGAVDTPKDARRINKITMPRLGGLAVILGFFVSVTYLLIVMTIENKIDLSQDNYVRKIYGFTIGAFLIGIICFVDDVRGVPALIKLVFQIAAASVVIKSGIMIDNLDIPIFHFENLSIEVQYDLAIRLSILLFMLIFLSSFTAPVVSVALQLLYGEVPAVVFNYSVFHF